MAIKKGDFIEINYTGKLSTGEVFDTTEQAVATEAGIFNQQTKYGPAVIVVGEKHVISGLDRNLEGKEKGSYHFDVPAEDAFGKKSAAKMKLIPAKFFKKDNVRPFPGLQVNIDNEMGIVRSVSGGRIIVDFNHPLASKDVQYDVEIVCVIEDLAQKVQSFFKLIGVPVGDVTATGDSVTITTKTLLPEQFTTPFADDIKRLTGAKDVTFEATGTDAKE
jgi:FKBP-type peptidyl-prolyl cis-trans isomerase SlyD